MLIHDVNPRWIIKPISRAAWRTSWHGNGLFTGSRFTAFNLPASLSPAEREREPFRFGRRAFEFHPQRGIPKYGRDIPADYSSSKETPLPLSSPRVA